MAMPDHNPAGADDALPAPPHASIPEGVSTDPAFHSTSMDKESLSFEKHDDGAAGENTSEKPDETTPTGAAAAAAALPTPAEAALDKSVDEVLASEVRTGADSSSETKC